MPAWWNRVLYAIGREIMLRLPRNDAAAPSDLIYGQVMFPQSQTHALEFVGRKHPAVRCVLEAGASEGEISSGISASWPAAVDLHAETARRTWLSRLPTGRQHPVLRDAGESRTGRTTALQGAPHPGRRSPTLSSGTSPPYACQRRCRCNVTRTRAAGEKRPTSHFRSLITAATLGRSRPIKSGSARIEQRCHSSSVVPDAPAALGKRPAITCRCSIGKYFRRVKASEGRQQIP
jgi:hypothetical protein